jgi:hypothetical protein
LSFRPSPTARTSRRRARRSIGPVEEDDERLQARGRGRHDPEQRDLRHRGNWP